MRRGPRALKRRYLAATQGRALRQNGGGDRRAAILLKGGIGDQIVFARFMNDLTARFPDLAFDVFSNDLETTRWLFSKVAGFGGAYIDSLFEGAQGAYAFALDMALEITVASRSRTSPPWGDLAAILDRIDAATLANRDLDALGVHRQPLFAMRQVYDNTRRHTSLHAIAGIDYGGDRLDLALDETLLEANGLAGRRYITVHTGFGVEQVTSGRWSTKSYGYFDDAIAAIRQAQPDLLIVQVGARNSAPLASADLRLIGQSTLPQVAAVLAKAAMHLDGETGMVHLARCLGVRSSVVFGPTNPDFFGYEANESVRPTVCGGCWWSTRDWMNTCPRGFDRPICTESIAPADVAQSALSLLA